MNTQHVAQHVLASPELKELVARLIEEAIAPKKEEAPKEQPVKETHPHRHAHVGLILSSTRFAAMPNNAYFAKDSEDEGVRMLIHGITEKLVKMHEQGMRTLVVPLRSGINFLVADAIKDPRLGALKLVLTDTPQHEYARSKRYQEIRSTEVYRLARLVDRSDKNIRRNDTRELEQKFLLDRVRPSQVLVVDTELDYNTLIRHEGEKHAARGASLEILMTKPFVPTPPKEPEKISFDPSMFGELVDNGVQDVVEVKEEAPEAPPVLRFNMDMFSSAETTEEPPVVKEEPPVVKEVVEVIEEKEEVVEVVEDVAPKPQVDTALSALYETDFSALASIVVKEKKPEVVPVKRKTMDVPKVLRRPDPEATFIQIVTEANKFLRKNGGVPQGQDIGTSVLLASLKSAQEEGPAAAFSLEVGMATLLRLVHMEAKEMPVESRGQLLSIHNMGGLETVFELGIASAHESHLPRLYALKKELTEFMMWADTEYMPISDLDVPARFTADSGVF